MFSTSLRRSAATLGVVAGLLAAAGPASAQVLPGMVGLTTPHSGSKAPRANSSEVAVESLTLARGPAPETANGFGLSFEHIDFVKAPTKADDQMKDNVKAVVVLIGANDYGFANGDAQNTQTSLERENSIECITLCHEGFEIR